MNMQKSSSRAVNKKCVNNDPKHGPVPEKISLLPELRSGLPAEQPEPLRIAIMQIY